jgi:hypothetical protein
MLVEQGAAIRLLGGDGHLRVYRQVTVYMLPYSGHIWVLLLLDSV